jgi:hypothetical protein
MKAQTGQHAPIDKPGATVPTPQVTVVVPSLNQGRYLEAALRSIAAQDVVTEIIVLGQCVIPRCRRSTEMVEWQVEASVDLSLHVVLLSAV